MTESNKVNFNKNVKLTKENSKNSSDENVCYHCEEVNDNHNNSSYCCSGCEKSENNFLSSDN
jgi:hypothetical protein